MMNPWIKKLTVATGALLMAFSAWALDVNRATAEQLQEIKGIGPVMAERIVKERKKGDFTSWQDLQERVNGVADGKSKQFSKAGLTVGKATYQGIGASKPVDKKAKVTKTKDQKKAEKPAAQQKKPKKTSGKATQ